MAAWAVGGPVLIRDLAFALGVDRDALRRELTRVSSTGSAVAPWVTLPGGRKAVTREAARPLVVSASPLLRRGSAVAAFVNLKGGVGKTTLLTHMAARAWQYGLSLCVVDLDPQASSTLALVGEPPENAPVFLDLWQAADEPLHASLMHVAPGLTLLPSSLDNTLLDGHLAHPSQQKRAVRGVCERLQARGADLILIDCPPTLGTAVISTLCAADEVLIPVCADAFSMKGLKLTTGELAAICETFALPGPRVRALFNRHDRRERLHQQALQDLAREHADVLMASVVRTTTHFSRALAERGSVFVNPSRSTAAQDVDAALRELLGLSAARAESSP
jgi:chromosome partitioning protein